MMRPKHDASKSQKGDTLVEVLMALAILAMAIVGAVTLMMRGHTLALQSLERSQVTARMSEQAQLLEFARDARAMAKETPGADENAYPTKIWWMGPVGSASGIATFANTTNIVDNCARKNPSFYLKKDYTAPVEQISVEAIDPASAIESPLAAVPGEGLWIEAVSSPPSAAQPYIDFHIKACWQPAGSGVNQQAKTIVRLYEP